MNAKKVNFTLPLGYADEKGEVHRDGVMRQANARDEIEIHSDERTMGNKRLRDCLILSQVITSLGELGQLSGDVIEGLYEVDFLYLQILYNKLNRENRNTLESRCPNCSNINHVSLSDMFKKPESFYSKKKVEA